MSGTGVVERARRILADPRDEWIKIAAEPATVQSLYTNWIMILAAIGPIALLLSMHPLQVAVAQYVRSLITTFVLALVVDALAPSFGGSKDFIASLKLTAYSYTAAWLAGVFNMLGALGDLVILIATLYALYTFLVGAPVLNRSSPDKAVPFTLVVVLCAVVLFFLARFAFTGMLAPPMHAGMGLAIR
ncbi:MAG TPA: Yip1 family protein [Casimicrobiaceae bacterium]|nr:Yip1 family protein [Casimicrobiaceae bacterium]